MPYSSVIADWYANQHVLVTGATGFMGKILVEKLLRSCPEISTIYLLIRPKKGKDPNQRLTEFINSEVFDKIKNSETNNKDVFKKLKVISGDASVDMMNLSEGDRKMLEENVTTVFHMAANVRFDQPLKPALLLNTGGTLRVLELACTLKKLKAFVHVSTSYCHCTETVLEEKIYPAPHNPRKMLDLVSWMDEDSLIMLTPKLLGDAPNTYAYTKCLTEQLVSEYASKIPIVITRPSIVVATWKDPLPGWVDNLNGPTGLLVGAGKGVIRTMHCNPDLEADVIPVDTTINSLIMIAWKLGTTPKKDTPMVYHLTSNRDYPITWGTALEVGKQHFYDNPFTISLWYPGGSIKSSYLVHVIAAFFFHLIPAYIVDFLLVLTRNKPFLVRTQKRIQNGLEVLQYYTTRPWYFHNENLINLWDELSNIDKEIFYTNRCYIDYNQFLLNYVLGARKYCIKEDPSTIPRARKILKRLYYLDVLKNIVLIGLVLWVFSIYATALLSKVENLVLH